MRLLVHRCRHLHCPESHSSGRVRTATFDVKALEPILRRLASRAIRYAPRESGPSMQQQEFITADSLHTVSSTAVLDTTLLANVSPVTYAGMAQFYPSTSPMPDARRMQTVCVRWTLCLRRCKHGIIRSTITMHVMGTTRRHPA